MTAAVVAAPASADPEPPVDLIVNGGFERPALVGGFTLYPVGSKIDGWKVYGRPGNVAIVSSSYSHLGIAFTAAEGTHWLDLTGSTNTGDTVEQTIKTEVGKTYRITFKIGNVVNTKGPYGVRSGVKVKLDGVPVFTARNDDGSGAAMTWKSFVYDFVATGKRTRVGFRSIDLPNDNLTGLDDVSVRLLPK